MPDRPGFAEKVVVEGALVRLRPATADDAAVLGTLSNDPEIDRLTGSVSSSWESSAARYTLDELREIYGRWATASDRIVWAVEDAATGAVVGEVVLNDLDERNLACGFRIWLAGVRDRGFGTEAVRLAVAHAIERVGLHRVELEVYDFNLRARHVYEKVGFVYEGTRRDALRFDGEWVDAHTMSVLAIEWEPILSA